MVKCDNCRKGRPKLWNKDGKFCDENCYGQWKKRQKLGLPEDFRGMEALFQ